MSRVNLDRWLARNSMPDQHASVEERRAYFNSMPEAVKREWDLRKAREDVEEPGYNGALAERARKRMERVDAMPSEMRAVVYEYGLEVVQEFINCGIKTPSRVKHLIDTVLHNNHSNGQPRFKINKAPYAKQNPVNLEPDDDDEYYIPRAQRR